MQPTFEIINSDIRDAVSKLPIVHTVVCSPPYFQQRKYGDDLTHEIGRDKDAERYIANLVDVFKAIPLHDAGSIWINIGDKRMDGALLNIPARFSLAMIDAGFDLIDHVIWSKSEVYDDGHTIGNCMTEPCHGRLNANGHEPMFRFIKRGADAWTDTCAVQIPRDNVETVRYLPDDLMTTTTSINGRNLLNVWNMRTGQTSEKHYAVYPPALCERPIAMTCPPFVNPDGTVPRRIVKRVEYDEGKGKKRVFGKHDEETSQEKKGRQDTGRNYVPTMPVSCGWEPILDGCTPGIVLDPFAGTGTTGGAALKLGRSFIGVELYRELCQDRRPIVFRDDALRECEIRVSQAVSDDASRSKRDARTVRLRVI